jgi:hypothetical protein
MTSDIISRLVDNQGPFEEKPDWFCQTHLTSNPAIDVDCSEGDCSIVHYAWGGSRGIPGNDEDHKFFDDECVTKDKEHVTCSWCQEHLSEVEARQQGVIQQIEKAIQEGYTTFSDYSFPEVSRTEAREVLNRMTLDGKMSRESKVMCDVHHVIWRSDEVLPPALPEWWCPVCGDDEPVDTPRFSYKYKMITGSS